jgi:hypothetical protein
MRGKFKKKLGKTKFFFFFFFSISLTERDNREDQSFLEKELPMAFHSFQYEQRRLWKKKKSDRYRKKKKKEEKRANRHYFSFQISI